MTPCPECARHVRDEDAACPFCGAAIVAAPRPRVQLVGRVTRAAVFSAALVACGGKKDEAKPAPPAGSAEHLDQDFNQLLGSAEGSAQPHAAEGSALPGALDAGLAAVATDAQVALDAGLSDEERTRQLQHEQERVEQQRRQRVEQEQRQRMLDEQRVQQRDWHNVAKPYGAPPARRRIV